MSVIVRWQGKKLDMVIDTSELPIVFKAQLYALTGVAPERQKVIIKGKVLNDDTWEGIDKVDGTTIMMMGSAGPLPCDRSNSATATENGASVSVKSSRDESLGPVLPCGLNNLGNTCYMNATLQCFKIIPELTASIKISGIGSGDMRHQMITGNVRKLYDMMVSKEAPASAQSENGACITPIAMLTALHNVFPQFASTNERGQYEQQDANECFTQVLQMLVENARHRLPMPIKVDDEMEMDDDITGSPPNPQSSFSEVGMRRFFEIEFETTLKNQDPEGGADEPVETGHDRQMQLSCFMSQEVRYIQSGIKSKMSEVIEKYWAKVNRNASFERHSLISRLPAWLSVQMVRFEYKSAKPGPRQQQASAGINAKILKDVKFPLVLDMFDLCTPFLQAKLRPYRAAIKAYEDDLVERQRLARISEDASMGLVSNASKNGDEKVLLASTPLLEYQPNCFPDDVGSNNSGYYELKALITHKGRSSNSGHYVAWVKLEEPPSEDNNVGVGRKQAPKQGRWAMCDDETVNIVEDEDILKLSGGGDWHCAYVLLYGPRRVPKLAVSSPDSMQASADVDHQQTTC